jgi:bacillithiol system protein YtxJ
VDVIRDRALAHRLADDLRIQHQSPQVIVLRKGAPQAHASHHEVSADRIEAWCGRVSSNGGADQS